MILAFHEQETPGSMKTDFPLPRHGPVFILAYVASYMLVAMGIFNVILAVYVTWKPTIGGG